MPRPAACAVPRPAARLGQGLDARPRTQVQEFAFDMIMEHAELKQSQEPRRGGRDKTWKGDPMNRRTKSAPDPTPGALASLTHSKPQGHCQALYLSLCPQITRHCSVCATIPCVQYALHFSPTPSPTPSSILAFSLQPLSCCDAAVFLCFLTSLVPANWTIPANPCTVMSQLIGQSLLIPAQSWPS